MINFQCDACGAPILVKGGNAFAQCEYCDTVSAVPKELLNVYIKKSDNAAAITGGSASLLAALESGEYARSLLEKMRTPAMGERVLPYQPHGLFQSKMLALFGGFQLMEPGEFPIIIYDDTLRSNGKNGFLITSKKLYFREMGQSIVVRFLNEITGVTLKKGWLVKSIVFEWHGVGVDVTVSMVSPPEDVFRIVEHIYNDYKNNLFEA